MDVILVYFELKILNGFRLSYLEEIDTTAKEMVNRLIKELVAKKEISPKNSKLMTK